VLRRLVPFVLLAGCSSEPEPAARPRVVILSDTHVIGPQYTEPVENTPADNESILQTPARLREIRDRVNALDPAPEAVFVLGDVVHAAHHSMDPDWYEANPNAFTEAREIFSGFEMPVHVLMGNHDYEAGCGGEDYPKSLSEDLFRHFFGAEPYYAVEVGGVKLLLLNGQQGRSWDVASPDCNSDRASFGAAQLAWLSEQLDDGTPAVVMSHYMGLLWDRDENPGVAGQEDVEQVLDAHPNVRMYLGGHTHRWMDLSAFFSAEQYVIGPARYDTDNFWLLELDGDAGTVTIPDRGKAIWANTCAQTWDYATMSATDAPELGTCVMGSE
jgi:3',5'-cyclic AMP phosphodiesterase CpdA